MFKGSYVAIVTPFADGKVDEKALRALVDYQIERGTDGIVPCGTSGESATLTYEEHCQVIDIVIDQTNKRVPVVAGTGSNSTHETVYFTEHAKKAGADGALLITPYYNKPSQEGLYQHYKYIAERVDIPIIMYNVPGRTACNMLPETVIKLSKIPNIVSIKEASGSMDQAAAIIGGTDGDFGLLAGEDALIYPLLCIGSKGVISASVNACPAEVAEMYDAFTSGNIERAKELHFMLLPLFDSFFMETNPVPVKRALELMGLVGPEIRLPLMGMTPEGTAKMKAIMEQVGIL
ncbi:dihydrodipicolinate synthase [Denitrovibrio acetiphilus DSM 12809]|uniref:4-hydroxy-tetrahydrodipicolinate synthase n=1 Tax=Denitrovibrio acetiphilus (strain DSM 12809 / NBRC 114555 / N2460) TaxID=522772 RepID=D4H4C2_DENA2|nr:4-hydroxy-tetrahydrodipicolinate synthase [Denitrovibrio acetiphilus]ADD69251.1 dihydrodipicolinate synthase [Denitrovibrio acetiphilus DSM 12809]